MRILQRLSKRHLPATLLCFIAAFLFGCAPKIPREKLQEAPWVIADVRFAREKTNGFGSAKTPEATDGFFRFFPNGQLCAFRNGDLIIGRWSWDPAQSLVRLDYEEEKSETYHVSPSLTQGLIFKSRTSQTEVIYTLETDTFDYDTRDIYSPSLNAWRVPAHREHTDEELQQRLLSMLVFLEAYFEAAAIRELDRVDVSTLPTPYLFASNGVAIYRSERLPDKWVQLFTSRDEAEYAARILGELFGDVTVPKTSNRFERNAQIFSQLKASYQLKIEQAAQPATAL